MGKPYKLKLKELHTLVDLYEAGFSTREVARILDITRSTVSYHLRRENVMSRKRYGQPPRSELRYRERVLYLTDVLEWSAEQIAIFEKTDVQTVKDRLDKARPQNEYILDLGSDATVQKRQEVALR